MPGDSILESLEAEARYGKRGLWADPYRAHKNLFAISILRVRHRVDGSRESIFPFPLRFLLLRHPRNSIRDFSKLS